MFCRRVSRAFVTSDSWPTAGARSLGRGAARYWHTYRAFRQRFLQAIRNSGAVRVARDPCASSSVLRRHRSSARKASRSPSLTAPRDPVSGAPLACLPARLLELCAQPPAALESPHPGCVFLRCCRSGPAILHLLAHTAVLFPEDSAHRHHSKPIARGIQHAAPAAHF